MNKNFVALILLLGLGVAGWMNKEKLTAFYQAKFGPEEAATEASGEARSADPEKAAPPRPNPATEAQAAVMKAYPALRTNGSLFNKKFLALHAEAEKSEPELLARPDWPIKLAERTAIALGGAPMPVVMSTPVPAAAPVPAGGVVSPAPTATPGLIHSSLDDKPKHK